MGAPEVGLRHPGGEDLLDHEAFPTGSGLRMPQQILVRGHAEQAMEQTAVTHVDLRRSDLPLGDVGEPGLQSTEHEGVGERIEVAPDGRR